MYRKGNILGIFPSDGLQDHVHIDVMLAQQIKHLECNAGIMLQPDKSDPGNTGILGNTGDIGFFHFGDLLHFRARLALQAGQHF